MNKNLKDRADMILQSIYLDGYEHGYKEAIQCISNFSGIDEIKAEIIEMRSKQNVGVLECLEIIDKHIEEKENKWKKSLHGYM